MDVNSAPPKERGNPEVFTEDKIKSCQDIKTSHHVKVAQPSLSVSAHLNTASGGRPSSIQMGWQTMHGAKGLSDADMSCLMISKC